MNRLFTLLFAASCLTAVGQVTYPYNPDGNADGDIAVGDLQDFLVTYGNPFSPSEIMVGDSSLTYWVEQLSQTVQEQQEMIENLIQSQSEAFTSNFGGRQATIQNLKYPQGYIGETAIVRLSEINDFTFQVPEGKNFYVYSKSYGPSGAPLNINGVDYGPVADLKGYFSMFGSDDIISIDTQNNEIEFVAIIGFLVDASQFSSVDVTFSLSNPNWAIPLDKYFVPQRFHFIGSQADEIFLDDETFCIESDLGCKWIAGQQNNLVVNGGSVYSFNHTSHPEAICRLRGYLIDENYFEYEEDFGTNESLSVAIDSLGQIVASLDSLTQIIEPFIGCTDPEACNYDFAVIDAGNCQYSDCLGVCGGEAQIDECGVCNGSGPSIPIIESVDILYDSVYAEQINEWFVFEVGIDTTYYLVCELTYGCTDSSADNYDPSAIVDDGSCWNCGEPVSYFDISYNTNQIGNQCWFSDNLRTTQYSNGDTLSSFSEQELAQGPQIGSFTTYGDNSASTCESLVPEFNACDSATSLENFGRLYNFFTIQDFRAICPSGWHVPTDSEWIELESFVGIDSEELMNVGWRGDGIGHLLKSEMTWDDGGNGVDAFGFNGRATGGTNTYGGGMIHTWAGEFGIWWSSTERTLPEGSTPEAWCRGLDDDISTVWRDGYDFEYFRSIRCIKDTE